MNLRARLSERVHIEDIREILHFIQDDEQLREEVYQFIFDEDDIVSYQALWVCTHFSKEDVEWLSRRQNELIDAAMPCPHSGKRRMLLNLLSQQLTCSIPELQQELRTMLEIMEPELLNPAIRAVRRNTLKAMKAKK